MMKRYIVFLTFISMMWACSPTAKFSVVKDSEMAPAEIKFMNESTKAETYKWNFGDGATSTDVNPVHQYALSGKYIITLEAQGKKKKSITTKEVFLDAPEHCSVLIETTYGNITVELFDETPQHRDNFIKLIEADYYDGLLFHRVIDGFMIQGGDPDSKGAPAGKRLGSGGPSYNVPAEISEKNVHVKGALAAARQGDGVNPRRESSGSQFYIVQGNPVSESTLNNFELRHGIKYTEEQRKLYLETGGTPQLDMNYTVFGQVVEGFDVIDFIAKTPKGPADRPKENITMKISIIK